MSKQDPIIFEELLHLDAPIGFVELNYSEEAYDKAPWFSEPSKIKPYIIAKNDGRHTYFYYDPKGIAWQKEQAGKYKSKEFAIKEMERCFGAIAEILKNEKALRRGDFLAFIKKVRETWQWLDYMWWAIEYKEEHKEPFDDLLALRKRTEYFTPGLIAVIRNSLKAMYPEKIKYADVILIKEVEEEKVPDDSVLKQRLKGYAYSNFKLYDSLEDVLKEFNIKIIEHSHDGDTLKGQTAFPGKVKGVVRIVEAREDMADFKQGEIIVSGTTRPDFLPVMKKAGAIVSEHGGAICHAAITSRELKIPCVVGVKGATKALSNGDLVEVDAGAGIINILKRA